MKTKGEIEAKISEAMVQFEMRHMGRGPQEARSYIIDDLILVRLKGALTPAEQELAKCAGGVELIKKMRSTLIDNARPELCRALCDASGADVREILTDVNVASGEHVFILMLGANLGQGFARKLNP